MLKIKDNVTIEDLKKFGFKPVYGCNSRTGETYIAYLESERYSGEYGFLQVTKMHRRVLHIFDRFIKNRVDPISLGFEDGAYLDIDKLYDLIQAGLVEKVEE